MKTPITVGLENAYNSRFQNTYNRRFEIDLKTPITVRLKNAYNSRFQNTYNSRFEIDGSYYFNTPISDVMMNHSYKYNITYLSRYSIGQYIYTTQGFC